MTQQNSAVRNCRIEPVNGSFEIESWATPVRAGFTETDAQALVQKGDLNKLDGVVPPSAVYECTHPLELLGRRIGLCISFREGRLKGVSIAEEGLSFWEETTHEANAALLQDIFGRKVRQSRWTSSVKFRGGEARAKFERNVGALTDGGASFNFIYDAPAADKP